MTRPPRVTVVGAGAAGLTAAIRAGEAGGRVTLLNAHPKIGLKILMSGGTRCNVTHREVDARDYFGGSRHVITRVLRAFTPEDTRAWFESMGVPLKLEDTGKYFPVSDDAQTVLDALLGACMRAGVEVRTGARAVRIEHEGSRWRLGLQSVNASAAFGVGGVAGHGQREWTLPSLEPDEWIDADAVVLATGGLSFPRTGSDGVGYALARALGHTLVPPVPALTPLAAEDPWCKALQGVALPVELMLWAGGKREIVITGPLLFTHFGYSGPAALDLSRHWLRAEGHRDRRVTASFVPGENAEQVLATWLDVAAKAPRETVRKWLDARLPESLVMALCDETGITANMRLSQLDRARRQTLIDHLVARELPVTGTLGYEKAEVTAGGVALEEVDPSTLESRKAAGVFLCGEMLDVEGRLGGFNFQWSWSSGTVAGRAAALERAAST